ncbi:hypothetical protein CVT24_000986 [Panaeolus cyanescens]|uniref:Major facilitator superfamily (MFS) profile domain-containing protein n=1 Tax=Panaeolus cyanescens TaxID=181874 RepID=A0A409YCF9_9AGAR|nr:hypothetical protein CVT24_000986 [Panaeolus cyanescens]
MFSTFPTKPIQSAAAKAPRPVKRGGRVTRQPKETDPAVPRPVRVIPDRPGPIGALPGLPSHVRPLKKESKKDATSKSFIASFFSSIRSWFYFILPKNPFARRLSLIPPPTPKTSTYDGEAGYIKKFLDELDPSGASQRDYKNIPPLSKRDSPEGGLVAWVSVATCFVIQFCTVGYLFTWTAFEAGKAADSGYFRHVTITGSAMFSVCLLILSFVPEEQFAAVFMLQAVGMGIGIGLVFVPTTVVPLHYFKRKRGLVLGIVMSGGCFGGAIFPTVVRTLIPRHGLGGAIRITGFSIMSCLVIANCVITTPPKEEKSLYPHPRLDLVKYSREAGYLYTTGSSLITMLIIFYPAMYLNLLGLERGVDPTSAYTSISILSLFGLFSRIGFGYASDRLGTWNLLMPISGLLALMMFVTCTVQGIKSLAAVAVFYGIFSSAWLSLMITGLASLANRTHEAGVRIGLVLSVASIPLLFSDLVQQIMLSDHHKWVTPSVVSGCLMLAVTGLSYLSRTYFAKTQKISYRRKIKGIQII